MPPDPHITDTPCGSLWFRTANLTNNELTNIFSWQNKTKPVSAEIQLKPLFSLERSSVISCGAATALLSVTSQQNTFAFSGLEVQKNTFYFNGSCIFKQRLLYWVCKHLRDICFFILYLQLHLCLVQWFLRRVEEVRKPCALCLNQASNIILRVCVCLHIYIECVSTCLLFSCLPWLSSSS